MPDRSSCTTWPSSTVSVSVWEGQGRTSPTGLRSTPVHGPPVATDWSRVGPVGRSFPTRDRLALPGPLTPVPSEPRPPRPTGLPRTVPRLLSRRQGSPTPRFHRTGGSHRSGCGHVLRTPYPTGGSVDTGGSDTRPATRGYRPVTRPGTPLSSSSS